MDDKSSVCAIIVTYNVGKNLLKCFNSIYNQVNEVVIIDNGSNVETISVLNELEKIPNTNKVFYNKENLRIAAALNQGVKYAIENGYEWVVTLDHDSIATSDMIEKMLATCESMSDDYKETIGMLCPRIYDINACRYLTNDRMISMVMITHG